MTGPLIFRLIYQIDCHIKKSTQTLNTFFFGEGILFYYLMFCVLTDTETNIWYVPTWSRYYAEYKNIRSKIMLL